MAARFREKYGLNMLDDPSFATPELSQKRVEVYPNQSYEVTIEGESVIVLGSSLKPMRSKKGYYRLLYQGKLYVLHTSEIREVDRTENDVVSGLDRTAGGLGGVNADDTDEDTTEMPAQNTNRFAQNTNHFAQNTNQFAQSNSQVPPNSNQFAPKPSFPPFMQSYNVKLNNTWLTLPSTAVTPSREMPGFYNVTYQGQIFNVTAVNVVPVNNTQLVTAPHVTVPIVTVPMVTVPGAPGRQTRQDLPVNPPPQAFKTTRYDQQLPQTNLNHPASFQPPILQNSSVPRHNHIFKTADTTQSALPNYQNFTPTYTIPATYTAPQGPNNMNTYPTGKTVLDPTIPTTDTNKGNPVASANVENITEHVRNMRITPRRTRPISSTSYTVEKPKVNEKVRVLVGGTWRTIQKKQLKPSKKKPETFIARVDDRSVRLKQSQIAEYRDEDGEKESQDEGKLCQVFLDGVYVTVPAENIQKAPNKIGFKIVTSNGITQLVHSNFIFTMKQTADGLKPVIPDFYKVYLTPGGVTVPKENIKPDERLHNTFMVLWNNIIYKLSAENLAPIYPTEKLNMEVIYP